MEMVILSLIFSIFFSIILVALTYMEKDFSILHGIVFVVASIAWGVFAAYLFSNYDSGYEPWVYIAYFAVAPIIIWLILTLAVTLWIPHIGFFGALLFAGLGWWEMEEYFAFSGTDLDIYRSMAVFCIVLYISLLGSIILTEEY